MTRKLASNIRNGIAPWHTGGVCVTALETMSSSIHRPAAPYQRKSSPLSYQQRRKTNNRLRNKPHLLPINDFVGEGKKKSNAAALTRGRRPQGIASTMQRSPFQGHSSMVEAIPCGRPCSMKRIHNRANFVHGRGDPLWSPSRLCGRPRLLDPFLRSPGITN